MMMRDKLTQDAGRRTQEVPETMLPNLAARSTHDAAGAKCVKSN